ncbi:hypothetical protein BC827DRAFT_1226609 [Russula dissimulans]|nr:hypothetical protein BC827DRAFT_1226609 [Russula dissimulans]
MASNDNADGREGLSFLLSPRTTLCPTPIHEQETKQPRKGSVSRRTRMRMEWKQRK